MNKKKRMLVYEKFQGHCAYCGCKLDYKDIQVDHIIAKRRGGTDEIGNLFPACRSCNHYKSTQSIEAFRDTVSKMPEVLMRDSVTYKNAVRFGQVKPNPHPVIFYFEKHHKEYIQLADPGRKQNAKESS